MDLLSFEELQRSCIVFGFQRQGKTFFRLIGDGVLQIIKCKYQRKLGGDSISIGLCSMYSYLQPQCFTA